jgi:Escherichia/Staphylococcus phage prohead protease
MNHEQRAALAGETRTITADVTFDPESRSDTGTLKGHAAVFNSTSEDLGFRETLKPGCFTAALKRSNAQQLLWQHDPTQILAARDAGTLELSEDGQGLAFKARPVNTSLGRDVAELARTGHVKKMSFSFTVAPGGDKWTRLHGEDHREIREVGELIEVSLVSRPAYTATSVSADRALAEVRAKGRLSIRERHPYSPGSSHSYFRDLARVQLAEERANQAFDSAVANGGLFRGTQESSSESPMPGEGSLEDAAARLREMRAIGSTAGKGGEFEPAGPIPPQLADAFVTSAGAASVLPAVLGSEPMPRGVGDLLTIPQFVNGVSVSVQSADGVEVSNTDPTTSKATSPPALISGFVNASQQLVDLAAQPDFDVFIARELGSALGTELDTQLLNGAGTENQTLGILKTTGITATTWTQATPTPQQLITVGIGACWSSVFTALKRIPNVILWHPRRHAWVHTGYDAGSKRTTHPHVLDALVAPTQVPAMPLVSSTQDPVIVLNSNSVRIYLDPPVIRAMPDPLSNTLQVRFVASQWCAVVVREPKGVGVVTGSGLTTPAFT